MRGVAQSQTFHEIIFFQFVLLPTLFGCRTVRGDTLTDDTWLEAAVRGI